MKVSFLKFGIFLSLSGLVMGCAGLQKPWVSERRGFLDREPQQHEARVSNQEESVVEVHSQASNHEAVRYFRGKKKRAGVYAQEVQHSSEILDLQWPLARVQVSSSFGKRGRSFHEGIDLRAKMGTIVLAAQAGKVIYASSKIRGYGKMIVIRHAGKLATIYAHNSVLSVRRGDFVHQGQEIARTGNSGRSTGPHLHFEVRRDVAALNPLQVLPASRSYDVSVVSASGAHGVGRSSILRRSLRNPAS